MTKKSNTYITSGDAAALLSSGGWAVSGGPGAKDWACGFIGKEITAARVDEINLSLKIGSNASLGCFSIPLEKDTKFDRHEPHILHVKCPTMQNIFRSKRQGGGEHRVSKQAIWLKFVNLRLKEEEVTRKRKMALKRLGIASKEIIDLKVAGHRKQVDVVLGDGTILRIKGNDLHYVPIPSGQKPWPLELSQ